VHSCVIGQVVSKEVIKEGVDLMLHTAIKLLGRKKALTAGTVLAIEDKKRAPNPGDGDSG
jgi:hypothetical protein